MEFHFTVGRDGVGKLFSRNGQESFSEKMIFKIKQRPGGMISAEETTNTRSLKLFSIITSLLSIR